MKIGFFEIEKEERDFFKKNFQGDCLFFSRGRLDSEKVRKNKDIAELEVVSTFIYSKIGESLLKKMPRLKLIATRSTGFDHIDIGACKKRKIKVCNVPSYGENTVAEHTFALILNLTRKIIDCVERTRRNCFDLEGLQGSDLKGKTLGVVGCGNIGRQVIKIGRGFGMKILVFDVYKDKKLAKKLGFRYVTLETLLKKSDIVTLHIPLNKQTYHLINEEKLSLMKKGAFLINTSRGGVIDTEALFRALKTKRLAGAGLDVLEKEDMIKEERELLTREFREKHVLKLLLEEQLLLKMPNVLVTPHNAFNTKEALRKILETTVENIKAFKKRRGINRVV